MKLRQKGILYSTLFVLLILSCPKIKSQNTDSNISIQYMLLKDSVMKHMLNKFIDSVTLKFTEYKDRGYLKVVGNSYPNNRYSDTTFVFYLSMSTMPLNKYEDDKLFPNYFAEINKRPVLFYVFQPYLITPFQYSDESKNILRKKIIPFLGVKPQKHIEKDIQTGKVLWIDDEYIDINLSIDIRKPIAKIYIINDRIKSLS